MFSLRLLISWDPWITPIVIRQYPFKPFSLIRANTKLWFYPLELLAARAILQKYQTDFFAHYKMKFLARPGLLFDDAAVSKMLKRWSPPPSQPFDLVPKWLQNFAAQIIKKYDIDVSHGITHLQRVTILAQEIIKSYLGTIIPGQTIKMSQRLLLLACYAHDLVDSKYVPQEGWADLRKVFLAHDYSSKQFAIIETIIRGSSFSVRSSRMKAGRSAVAPGPCYLATCILADADQLDAYCPARCKQYKYRFLTRPDYLYLSSRTKKSLARKWQRELLTNRVMMYRDHYMLTAIGKKMAGPLHTQLEKYLAD